MSAYMNVCYCIVLKVYVYNRASVSLLGVCRSVCECASECIWGVFVLRDVRVFSKRVCVNVCMSVCVSRV